LLPLRFFAGDFLVRLFDFFAVALLFRREDVAFRDLLARPFDFDPRAGRDFFLAAPRDFALERVVFVLDFDFEELAFREPLRVAALATDFASLLAFLTVFLARGSMGFPLAAARPARPPRTPPTTAPTGPATLPITAPVTAPAVCFEIGGISMFSEPPESPLDFLSCSSAIGRVAPVDFSVNYNPFECQC
jgi:hypothetical protein